MIIEPTRKTAPTRDGDTQGRRLGTIYKDSYLIFVYESVLEQVLEYSESDTSREVGGFLLGGLHEDTRKYVEIRHFLPARNAQSAVASLTFTHDTWAEMNRQVEEQYPGEIVLGWHHTHPNFGIFLSGYDLFIHRHFFGQEWQLAMVVDPLRAEFGFFQWHQDEVVDCGFVCVWKKSERTTSRFR